MSNSNRGPGIIGAAALVLTSPAFAHGDHGGGGGVVVPPGVTLVTLTYDQVDYQPLGQARLNSLTNLGLNAHSMRSIAVPSAVFAHGLTQDLSFSVRLPFLANRGIHETGEAPGDPVVARGGVYGVGDVSFTGTYRVIRESDAGFNASMTLGVKAPSGRKDAVDRFGEIFEAEHQPSSGSWDGLFGGSVSKQYGSVSVSANMLFSLSGHGSQDTTPGDRLSYGAAVSYRLWASGGRSDVLPLGGKLDGMMHHGGHHHDHAAEPRSHGSGPLAVDVSLGINGQWHGKQAIAGVLDDNTGGNVVMLTPSVRVSIDKWEGFVNFGIPISRELNGIQSEPNWQLSTGVALAF